jgi:hypothetical protein
VSEQVIDKESDENEEPVEIVGFDIPQIHLVNDPANARRILTRKGMKPMATPPPFEKKPPEGETKAPSSEGSNPAPAAAGEEKPKEGEAKPKEGATPAKAMKLSPPIRGSLLATLQGLSDKCGQLMQMVDSAEPSEDMTVPGDIQASMDAMKAIMDMGLEPFKVSKRFSSPQVSNYVRGVLDTMQSALDKLQLGPPVAEPAVSPSAAPVAAPAATPAAAAPAAEAPVADAVQAAVTKSIAGFRQEMDEKLLEKDKVIKSLTDDLNLLRKSHPGSALVGVGTSPPPAGPQAPNPQNYSDLNRYREDLDKFTAQQARQ